MPQSLENGTPVRRGDLGVVSFAKLVAAVLAAMLPLITGAVIWVRSEIRQQNSDQDAINRDVFVTRREYDVGNRVLDEKLRDIKEEQRRARDLQERMAARMGIAP